MTPLSTEQKLTEEKLYEKCLNFANNLMAPSSDIEDVHRVAGKVFEQLKFLVKS